MASIMYRDPEHEASFSFSCYDVNSALQVFSDADEGGINDDEYIEIELEQPRTTFADDDGSRDEELELRISFSSSVPFLEIPNHHNIGLSHTSTVEGLGNDESEAATTPSSSSLSTLSCSSGDTYWGAATDQPSRTRRHKTIKQSVQFRASNLNCLLTNFQLPTTLKPSSLAIVEKHCSSDDESRQIAIQTINQSELVSSRKATKATKATSNGVVTKFLIKCRSITIRALMASFVKPYQINISPQSNSTTGTGQKKMKRSKETLRADQSLVKPIDKWLVQRDQKAYNIGERSKVFDVNMAGIKEVLNLGCKDKKTSNSSSCSSRNTNYSLPIQRGCARDSSIQAAIAHCKRSFGQASEFPFKS